MSDQQQFWDERYRGAELAFGERANLFLMAEAHRIPRGGKVLVPGDGQGRNGVWLAGQGFAADSVDISQVAVEKAKELAAARGVAINAEVADLTAWDWPRDAYDAVALLYVHFFDADRPRLHRAALGALKPGGVLLLEAFSLRQLEMHKQGSSGGPKTADMLYSREKLAGDFAGANVVLLEETGIVLDEGHRHKGPAAIVRAIIERP